MIRFNINDFLKLLNILLCFAGKDEIGHSHFKCEADLEDVHKGFIVKDSGDK